MRKKDWVRNKHHKELALSRLNEPGRFPYILVMDHLKPGFNVGKIIRSANAFGAKEVHMVGIEVFDPSSSAGALRHTRTRSFATFVQCYEALVTDGYTLFALDPEGGSVLGRTGFPKKTAFVLGHEEYGFSFKFEEFPLIQRLKIAQFGKVQSLNVSVAASLACYEYVRQNEAPL